ncbi:hypothetical protein vBAmePPT11V19_00070 [Alteromonas phage vB_AmeP_PT11-V19]|nr:hypothetical protein vBAmePPT11V19_00070 [Alteromonas phage vB_AmeP_PT11-V19]
MNSPWIKCSDRLPPVNTLVVGKFEPIVTSAQYHVSDCQFNGKVWTMLGNDNVRDIYVHDPVAWQPFENLDKDDSW